MKFLEYLAKLPQPVAVPSRQPKYGDRKEVLIALVEEYERQFPEFDNVGWTFDLEDIDIDEVTDQAGNKKITVKIIRKASSKALPDKLYIYLKQICLSLFKGQKVEINQIGITQTALFKECIASEVRYLANVILKDMPTNGFDLGVHRRPCMNLNFSTPIDNLSDKEKKYLADILTRYPDIKHFSTEAVYATSGGERIKLSHDVFRVNCVSAKHAGQQHFEVRDFSGIGSGGFGSVIPSLQTFRLENDSVINSHTSKSRVFKFFNSKQTPDMLGAYQASNQLFEPRTKPVTPSIILFPKVSGIQLYEFMGTYQPQNYSKEFRLLIIYQSLQAVLSLHEKGLLHRDIKPENLMIDLLSILKGHQAINAVDWDFVTKISENDKRFIFTPLYIAPELNVAESPKPYSRASDAFAWARIVAFCLGADWSTYQSDYLGEEPINYLRRRDYRSMTRGINVNLLPPGLVRFGQIIADLLKDDPNARPELSEVAETLEPVYLEAMKKLQERFVDCSILPFESKQISSFKAFFNKQPIGTIWPANRLMVVNNIEYLTNATVIKLSESEFAIINVAMNFQTAIPAKKLTIHEDGTSSIAIQPLYVKQIHGQLIRSSLALNLYSLKPRWIIPINNASYHIEVYSTDPNHPRLNEHTKKISLLEPQQKIKYIIALLEMYQSEVIERSVICDAIFVANIAVIEDEDGSVRMTFVHDSDWKKGGDDYSHMKYHVRLIETFKQMLGAKVEFVDQGIRVSDDVFNLYPILEKYNRASPHSIQELMTEVMRALNTWKKQPQSDEVAGATSACAF